MTGTGLATVEEKAKVLMGQSPPSSACSEAGDGLPFIQGNAEFGRRNPSPKLRCSTPTRIAEVGDILLSVRAPVGELNQAVERTIIGRGLSAIRFDSVDQSFSWHAMKFAAPALNRVAQGSTFVAVSREDVERLRIPWYDEENPRIADVLDTADEAIAKTEGVSAKWRQVRAGLLHDLFTRGLDQEGHLRDAIAHPKQFQDSPLGQIPCDWEVTSLGEALSMKAGKMLKSEHISEMDTYPVYGGNGLRGYTSNYTHDGHYALIGRQGALCGNIVLASGRFFATEHAVVCDPVKRISAGWLACSLLRMDLNRFSESSAQPGLSVQKIAHQKFALPGFDEQISIEAQLNSIDANIKAADDETAKFRHLKSGLMTDLLTGRVHVPAKRP